MATSSNIRRKLTAGPIHRISRDTWRKASLQELTSAVKNAKLKSANISMRIDVVRRQMLTELQKIPDIPDNGQETTNGSYLEDSFVEIFTAMFPPAPLQHFEWKSRIERHCDEYHMRCC
ncbi:hypothetical protein Ddc_05125 [Ditylenchus destructor]|nr:hypothetical protein Ddc_05125 [Ditylenchus destructor]